MDLQSRWINSVSGLPPSLPQRLEKSRNPILRRAVEASPLLGDPDVSNSMAESDPDILIHTTPKTDTNYNEDDSDEDNDSSDDVPPLYDRDVDPDNQ